MPFLFVYTTVTLLGIYICDKLLITYYYQERAVNCIKLDRYANIFAKYAISLFLIFGAVVNSQNNCTVTNETDPIDYTNEILDCKYINVVSIWLIIFGVLAFSFCAIIDIVTLFLSFRNES
jgi:hypothetical protein